MTLPGVWTNCGVKRPLIGQEAAIDCEWKLRNLRAALEAFPRLAPPSYLSCSRCEDTGEVTRLSDGTQMPCFVCIGSIYEALNEPKMCFAQRPI